jgi:hypothetical protein
MDLSTTYCPYDSEILTLEIGPEGLFVIVCFACHAAWELHGSFIGRRQSRETTQSRDSFGTGAVQPSFGRGVGDQPVIV